MFVKRRIMNVKERDVFKEKIMNVKGKIYK